MTGERSSAEGARGPMAERQRGPSRDRAEICAPAGRKQPGIAVVEACSTLATVQDGGRPGFGHLGVPRAGAADPYALALANALVGNRRHAPALEVAPGRFALRLLSDAVIALTGAARDAHLDGRPVAVGTSVFVPAGALLSLGAVRGGLWTYLGLGGGICCDPVLGSCSGDTLSGLGPPPLATGRQVPFGGGGTPGMWAYRGAPGVCGRDLGARRLTVRVTPGPHVFRFDDPVLAALVAHVWTVGRGSDRTGLRLEGPPLPFDQDLRQGRLEAVGMVPGAIQVTPGGQPILLGVNHGTTGGYPVVAVVCVADLGLAAQSPPGSALRFGLITREAASTELRRRMATERIIELEALCR